MKSKVSKPEAIVIRYRLPDEKLKKMKCISQLSTLCAKEFLTTPEYRICAFCKGEVENLTRGAYELE